MSLRLRLGLWYGALTALAVLLVGLMTYATHTRAHYDDLDHSLAGAAAHAAEEVGAAAGPAARAAAIASAAPPGIGLRLYGAGGELLAASPDAAPAPVVEPRLLLRGPSEPPFDPIAGLAPPAGGHASGPAAATGAAGAGVLHVARGADGTRWRLLAQALPGGNLLVATAPLDRSDASVRRLRQLLAVFSVGGVAMTFLAAWLLAGRALRPVAVMTETAAAIARARSFSRRVPEGLVESAGPRRDELGRLAATFNEMLASLERAYEAERRFVSDASHELRAPLTAIQANLELLRRQPDMPPQDREEAVAEAEREARRLAAPVGELLARARADAGVGLQRQRVELERVVMEALAEARHLARGQALDLAGLEPAVVTGDPDRLKQVLLILLDNALKYTPSGGQVRLALAHTDGERAAQLTVADTGIGIAAEHLPRVFERFYRADPARSRDPGGSGLGLPIARWIVEQHGGRISLASEPGAGTTATVVLPLAE